MAMKRDRDDNTCAGDGDMDVFLASMTFAGGGRDDTCGAVAGGMDDFFASLTFGACPCCVGGDQEGDGPSKKKLKRKHLGKTLVQKQGPTSLYEWVLPLPSTTDSSACTNKVPPKQQGGEEEETMHRFVWIRSLPLGSLLSWRITRAEEEDSWQPLPTWRESEVYLVPSSPGLEFRHTTRNASIIQEDASCAELYVCQFPPSVVVPEKGTKVWELSWHNIALNVAREALPLFQNQNSKTELQQYQRLSGRLGETIALGLDMADVYGEEDQYDTPPEANTLEGAPKDTSAENVVDAIFNWEAEAEAQMMRSLNMLKGTHTNHAKEA